MSPSPPPRRRRPPALRSNAPVPALTDPGSPRQRAPESLRLQRMLVPVDFSSSAVEALRFVLPFAQECGARIDLLHVVTPLVLPAETTYLTREWGRYEAGQRAAAAAELERLAAAELTSVPSGILVRTGDPRSVIGQVAGERRSDWVVLATHGRRGLKRFLLGSTAEAVVRRAPCPVLTVRQPVLRQQGTPQTPPSGRIRRVLVPVDFATPTRGLLEYAAAFANTFRASLHLLHVVERLQVPTRVAYAVAQLQGTVLRRGQERLAEAAARVGFSPRTTTQTVRIGTPYDVITQLARRLPVDLIIVATHGHGGLRRLFLGSTTERVLRHAPCPVVVVRGARNHGQRQAHTS